MKILITGISGYIGQSLLNHIKPGYSEIIGLDKKSTGTENCNLEKFVLCDLGNKEEIENIDKDIDILIHLAGEANAQANKESHYRNNVLGSLNLLEYAGRYKVKKIIFLSSNKAGNRTHYGNSKTHVETEIINLAETVDIKYTILRSAIVYGPGMRSSIANWIKLTSRKYFPALPTSRSVIEMIGIGDLSRVIEICISDSRTDNKVYELSDGHPYNVNDIELKSRKFFNTQAPMFTVPKPVIYILATLGDLLGGIGLKLPINSGSYQMLFNNQSSMDITLEQDTGFKPTQNFYDEFPHIFQTYKQ